MVKVVKGLPAEWGMCSRTVQLNSRPLALSYHNTIAIGSESWHIIILSAITGSQTAVLSGHTDYVTCLTFSSDGTSLVSGSNDRTVKLWDLQTGGVAKTFSGHTESVLSVSVSPDLATIASGSWDNTIHLWNIQTGECYQIIQQQNWVSYVAFSPTNPKHLVSICGRKVWQWDTNGHQIKPPYDGSCIAFSPDGTQLVSCSGAVAKVQNSDSGVTVAEFNAVCLDVYQCCFSPDGRLVAVAAGEAAYVWDITSSDPHLVGSFIGHTADITSLVFSSSSLISASKDKSVKWWKIGSLQTDQVVTDPKSISFTEAQITLQAKDGITITIHPDDTVKTWDISTGVCKASFQIPTGSSAERWRDIQLIDGRLIFVWSAVGKIDILNVRSKINIWDVEKGKLLLAVERPRFGVEDIKISGDGSRIFYLDSWSIQAWSVQTGEIVGKTEVTEMLFSVKSLAVDGTRVWACYPDSEYEGWDFGIPGSLPVQLPNVPPYRLYPNGAVLWDTGLSRVKDNRTGKVVFQLSGRHGKPVDVQWNGQFLVVCYTPQDILILDFSYLLP